MSPKVKTPIAIAISARTFDPPFTQAVGPDVSDWANNSVDFAYLDLADNSAVGLSLEDVYRVLAPHGILRVCAIDLDQIVHAYLFDWRTGDGSGLTRAQRFERLTRYARGFVRNEEDLTGDLMSAGFVEVRRFLAGAGSHPFFWDRELEHEHRLVLEARKPGEA